MRFHVDKEGGTHPVGEAKGVGEADDVRQDGARRLAVRPAEAFELLAGLDEAKLEQLGRRVLDKVEDVLRKRTSAPARRAQVSDVQSA
jgi:hypothetical protein